MPTTQHDEPTERRTVRIPGGTDHAGHHLITLTLRWVCPTCGGPRGTVRPAISYDGSRRLGCDGWTNPCGHLDAYAAARVEPPTTGRVRRGGNNSRSSTAPESRPSTRSGRTEPS